MSKKKVTVEVSNAGELETKGISPELVDIATQELTKLAEKEGTTPEQLYTDLKAEVARNDTRALSTVQDLTQMIVEKYQQTLLLHPTLKTFINFFTKDRPQGNGRQYIKHIPVAPNEYDKSKFIPDNFTDNHFYQQIIKFLEDDGSLAPNAYKDRYAVVWTTTELFTRFINGQYLEFIQNDIASKMETSFTLTMYDRIMNFLIDKVKAGKQITGTRPDMFSTVTEELIPAIARFQLNTNEFNLKQTLTEIYDASKLEDIVLLCNSKVYSMLKSNIMSQLFNSSNIKLEEWVGTVHIVNNKITLTPDQPIQHLAVPYLDDTEIIVYDKKNFIKIFNMLNEKGAQQFPLNLGDLRVFHYWWVIGALDWGKAFYFKNPNLTVSPTP